MLAVGVNNVLALRGDKPRDMPDEQFEQRIFPATDLKDYEDYKEFKDNIVVNAS